MSKNHTKSYNFTSGEKKPQDEAYNSGVKISGKKSKFSSKKVDKEEFERRAAVTYENDQEVKNKAFKLSSQFMTMLKDKTLGENKSPIQKDLEGDISRQIVEIAMALNNDESKPEGIGSAGSCMLLFRCVLVQRDVINELSWKVKGLENKVYKLSSAKDTDESK